MPIIKNVKNNAGLVRGVYDKDGLKNDPDFVAVYKGPPPKLHSYWDDAEGWVPVHAVDRDGNYLGNIPFEDAFILAPCAPPNDRVKYDYMVDVWVEPDDNEDEDFEIFKAEVSDYINSYDHPEKETFLRLLNEVSKINELVLIRQSYENLVDYQRDLPYDTIVFSPDN